MAFKGFGGSRPPEKKRRVDADPFFDDDDGEWGETAFTQAQMDEIDQIEQATQDPSGPVSTKRQSVCGTETLLEREKARNREKDGQIQTLKRQYNDLLNSRHDEAYKHQLSKDCDRLKEENAELRKDKSDLKSRLVFMNKDNASLKENVLSLESKLKNRQDVPSQYKKPLTSSPYSQTKVASFSQAMSGETTLDESSMHSGSEPEHKLQLRHPSGSWSNKRLLSYLLKDETSYAQSTAHKDFVRSETPSKKYSKQNTGVNPFFRVPDLNCRHFQRQEEAAKTEAAEAGDNISSLLSLMQSHLTVKDMRGIPVDRDLETNDITLSHGYRAAQIREENELNMRINMPNPASSSANQNYQVAVRALQAMLEADDVTQLSATQELLNDTCASVLLLPMLEDYLRQYIDSMDDTCETEVTPLTEMTSTPSSDCSGVSIKLYTTLDSLPSQVTNMLFESAQYANKIQAVALRVLQLLYSLVSLSSYVQSAILVDDVSEEADSDDDEDDVTVSQTRHRPYNSDDSTSDELSSSDARSRSYDADLDTEDDGDDVSREAGRGVENDVAFLPESEEKPVLDRIMADSRTERAFKNCRLLPLVLRLANPQYHAKLRSHSGISLTSLRIILQLITVSHPTDFHQFKQLITDEIISNALYLDLDFPVRVRLDMGLVALDITIELAASPLLQLFCSREQKTCFLLALLDLTTLDNQAWLDDLAPKVKTQYLSKITRVFLCAFANHYDAHRLLLNNKCECSKEMLCSLRQFFFYEYKDFLRRPDHDKLTALKMAAHVLANAQRGAIFNLDDDGDYKYMELCDNLTQIIEEHEDKNEMLKDPEVELDYWNRISDQMWCWETEEDDSFCEVVT